MFIILIWILSFIALKILLAGQGRLTPDRLALKVFLKSALVNPTVDGTCKDGKLRATNQSTPKEIHEFCNQRKQDHMFLCCSKLTSLAQCIFFSTLTFTWHSIFLSDQIIVTNPDKECRKQTCWGSIDRSRFSTFWPNINNLSNCCKQAFLSWNNKCLNYMSYEHLLQELNINYHSWGDHPLLDIKNHMQKKLGWNKI